MHFLPEETKEKIGGFFSGLAEKIGLKGDNDDMIDLDKKLVAESDGKGYTDSEREEFLKKVQDMPKNNGGMDDPFGQNVQEGNPASTENSASDAAQATAEAYEMPQEEKDFLRKQVLGGPNSGPDPIIQKLKEMGVLSPSDEKVLIAAGHRTDGPKIASHALNAYLGLPADREVSVHANLTPEQQKELINFVHSKEYTEECTEMNEAHKEAIARRLAKVRGKINGGEGAGGGNGNSNGFHLEENHNNGTPVETKYTFEVSQRKKAIFNIVNKSMNPEQTSVDLSTMYTKEQLSQMTPEQIEKASMQAAAYKYIQEHGVKRAEIVDKDGNVHTYYREDMKRDGDVVTKRVDRTTDGDKVTTKMRTSGNGAALVKYSGKEEQVTYTDEHGNKVNIGGEGEDKVKRVVVDPTTGKEYTLVKGDDGKMYTLEKDLRTGQTTVSQGGSNRQMNRVFKDIKQNTH